MSWSETLAALPADEAAAAARGIRRAADKLGLPPSARAALDAQGATYWAGAPPLFSVEALGPDGVTSTSLTHAGVLAYDAPPGTVRLPAAVCRSLWGGGAGGQGDAGAAPSTPPPGAAVRVTYARLPTGAYARLQPVQAGLLTGGGEGGGAGAGASWDVREALEAAVRGRCALTVGDVLCVPAPAPAPPPPAPTTAGPAAASGPPPPPPPPPPAFFTVLVRELRPPSRTGGVSVVEVDLAVDLDPSVESEAAAAAAAEAAGAARAAAAAAAAVAAERLAASLRAATVVKEEEEEDKAQGGPAAPDLPPEPGVAGPGTLAVRLRLPGGGGLAARRWAPADPASALVAWAAHAAGARRPVRLVLPPLPGTGGGRLVLPADATPLGAVPGLGPGAAVVLVLEEV